jgi:N-carbamoyl-L-amino-acid hydrolase
MNRRQFVHGTAMGLSGISLHPVIRPSIASQPFHINGQRLNRQLGELAEFGRLPNRGINRVAYSQAALQAREFVRDLMRAAGLDVSGDTAGNIIGRREGSSREMPSLMFGSHIDSVPQGGNYDGPLGSLGAIEVAQTLAEHDVELGHPIEIVVFQNEEGGKTGSRAMSGELNPEELSLVTHSGHTIGEGIRIIGGDANALQTTRREPGDIAAFVELHIEQGGILEKEQIQIGVVEGIVGIKRWHVTIDGFANHAGTTPMNDRQDALLAAGRFIDAVNRVATDMAGSQVATVGQIEASPGAPNVIPGQVTLSLEIRDVEMGKIDRVYQAIETRSQELAAATNTRFSLSQYYVSRAAPTDERILRPIGNSAIQLGLSSMRMPSGAGHDAQSIALLAPIGMIFIPSVRGISHSPEEFSRPEDVVNGANVLLNTILKLDSELD